VRYQRLGLLLIGLITCGGLTHITVSQTASATIPGASLLESLVGDVGFGGFANFDITQSQELKNQGVKREQIDSVKIQSLTLEITAPPSGQDFTFLESIAFFVDAPGQPQKQVAHGGPFTAGATSISMTIDDVELAPYATATSMTFTSKVTGKKPKTETVVLAKVILGADVNIGGLICGSK
jgi:hypothetical protein